MTQHIVSLEADVSLPAIVTPAAILSLVSHILATELVAEPWQIGIQFVDDETMQAAHKEFMDIDEPTDIMTFPYADDDDIWGESEAGGDLMISVDTAQDNAAVAGLPLASELFFLVAHGLLHLLGWDDHSPEDRAVMLARQDALLASWEERP